MSRFRILLYALPILGLAEIACADTFPVGAQATYLRVDAGDTTTNPVIINLSALSFAVTPGTTVLQVQRNGSFSFTSGDPDDDPDMDGVFSSSNSILSPTSANRVPGAITSNGVPFVNGNTLGGVSQDIPQDFIIDNRSPGAGPAVTTVDVTVPLGANYLIVGAVDSHYADNTDPNGDFAVSVTLAPEPGSLLLLAGGCAALLARGRRALRRAS